MNTPTDADRREVREFACETKFLIDASQAVVIEGWMRAHLAADPHGSGEHRDRYEVSSLYFDTRDYAVYRRIGSYGRSKFRVRRYDQRTQVFVERKTKTQASVSKRRSLVLSEELSRLQGAAAGRWPGDWFRRRLELRGLMPVCQISYSRTARIGVSEYGPCRITLDRNVRARSVDTAGFIDMDGTQSLLDGACILELKYRYTLPVAFRQLLAEYAPVPQRISKYRLAVQALGLAAGENVEETASELAGS